MTTLTIEIPDDLMAKLAQQERPIQEIVVAVLEDALEKEPVAPSALNREQMIQSLVSAGLIREPGTWDSPAAKAWRDLPEAEKEQHLKEVAEMYFPDSPASRAVIRGRMRLDEGLSRAEMAKRLIRSGIARNPQEWDTPSARQWRKLSAAEKQQFIDETRSVRFADSPAQQEALETAGPPNQAAPTESPR